MYITFANLILSRKWLMSSADVLSYLIISLSNVTQVSSFQEKVGEGGTVHITKTIFSGDGSVRREMRFRTQSADSRVTQGTLGTHRWAESDCDELFSSLMSVLMMF